MLPETGRRRRAATQEKRVGFSEDVDRSGCSPGRFFYVREKTTHPPERKRQFFCFRPGARGIQKSESRFFPQGKTGFYLFQTRIPGLLFSQKKSSFCFVSHLIGKGRYTPFLPTLQFPAALIVTSLLVSAPSTFLKTLPISTSSFTGK